MKLYIKSSLSDAEEQALIDEEMGAIETGNFDKVRNKNIYKEYVNSRGTVSEGPGTLYVEVENTPTVKDADGYIHQFRKSPTLWPVNNLKEAADAVRFFIRKKNLGGSEFTGGTVYTRSGQPIAKISYNGSYTPITVRASSDIDSDRSLLTSEGQVAYDIMEALGGGVWNVSTNYHNCNMITSEDNYTKEEAVDKVAEIKAALTDAGIKNAVASVEYYYSGGSVDMKVTITMKKAYSNTDI